MAWTQKLPSGNWRGLYRIPGGDIRGAGTFPYEKRALGKATQLEEEAHQPGWRDPQAAGRKWGDWCATWEGSRKIEEGTSRADASAIKVHLRPYWGETRLGDITRFAVKEWAAHLGRPKELGGAGLKESSVARTIRVFSSSLSAAVDAEILKANPCFRLALEPADNDVMRFFTRKEISKMLKKLKDRPRDRAMLALLVGTGLRWGEMAGLRPEAVDLNRRMLRVVRTRTQRGKAKRYPKSRKMRDVPIPEWVVKEIKPFVKAATPGEYVFPFTNSSNWRRDVWTPLKTGGRIHDLRHTYASLLLQGGVEMAKVSKLMGHASVRITERYAHIAKVPMDEVDKAMTDPRV